MSSIQDIFDALSEAARNSRSGYHLTLGGLIAVLESVPSDTVVVTSDGDGVGRPQSYRGYYSDLSFRPGEKRSASEVLADAKAALGNTFEGYKGGDYVMSEDTPLWVAHYGCTGPAIVGFDIGEELVLTLKEID